MTKQAEKQSDVVKYYWPAGVCELTLNQRFIYKRDLATSPDPCVLVELTSAEDTVEGGFLTAAGCTREAQAQS